MFLAICSDILLLALLFFSLYQLKWVGLKEQYFFSIYVLVIVVIEAIGMYYQYVLVKNNSMIYNYYFLISALYYSYIFSRVYSNKWSKGIVFFIGCLAAFQVVKRLPEGAFYRNDCLATSSNLILLVYFIMMCLVYFLDIILIPKKKKLSDSFSFWFTIAVFIWSTIIFLRLGGANYLNENNTALLRRMVHLTSIINIIMYSSFLKALLCIKKK